MLFITHTRFRWNSWTFILCFFFVGLAVALPSFVGNPHSGYSSEGLKRALENLPEEQHELVKRQLGQLLGDVFAATTVAIDPLGAATSALEGSDLLSGLLGIDVEWPLDVWDRFRFNPPGPGESFPRGINKVPSLHKAGDQRGPCVGLNAMANHGMIDHSGVVHITEVLWGAQVLGMSLDLALILAVQAFVFGGDPTTLTMSIGGVDDRIGSVLGGLGGLGQPQGLSYIHNVLELDSSPIKDDLYDTGDASSSNVDRFIKFWSLVPPGGRFDLSVCGYWAAYRFEESINISPNFFYGPAAGVLARTGTYGLVARALANQSGAYLDGELTHEILETFYGFTHWPEPFTYRPGWERIPENWYGLRSVGSSYSTLQVVSDVFGWCDPYPDLCSFGGNVAGVNTFVGLRLDDPSLGLEYLGLLTDPSNFVCFALQVVKNAAPTWTNNLFATLFEILGTSVTTLGCPEIPDLTRGGVPLFDSLKQQFPGAR